MDQLRPYFTRQALSTMNPQEISFAKDQLRKMLSQQMSKVSTSLSKRQKVQANLKGLQRFQQQLTEERILRLSKRFAHIQDKRKQVIQKRIDQCKQYDEKLKLKTKQRQRRILDQQRQAGKKSKAYSIDLLKYLKQKELQQITIQQKKKKQFLQKQKQLKLQTEQLMANKGSIQKQKNNNSKTLNKTSNPLDQTINLHQIRAKIIQQQTMNVNFQKILKKMDIMNQKKLKAKKQKKQMSPVQRRFVSSYNYQNDKKQKYTKTIATPKRNTYSKKASDYLMIKRQKQQRQFEQRGEMFAKMLQKSRKDDITRHIRNKVRQYSVGLLNKTK